MAIKRLFFVAIVVTLLMCLTIGVVYAQSTTDTTFNWFSWQALIEYMAVAAFFGFVHDLNDGKGSIILPHQLTNGSWDLGIISPAILGAAAGFIALSVQNTAFFDALFPSIGSPKLPGLAAAAVAGYLYSKTLAVVLSTWQASQTQAAAATK